ncbi:hybrid sensor histidine kinase/response regulator transcription factor [Niabella terrae]
MSHSPGTYWLLFILACSLAFPCDGQVIYKTEHFSSEDGLSHRKVSGMLKDDEGFMWFGTWNGFNRFDGTRFKNYKNLTGAGQGVHNDRIRQIVDDHQGHLWIVTYDKYLYRFDKRREIFIPINDIINKAAGKSIQVHGVSLVTKDHIWLITVNEGVICLPLVNITAAGITRYHVEADPDYALDADHVFFIYRDQNQFIWIGNTGGISRFRPSPSGTYIREQLNFKGTGKKNFTKISENADCIFLSSHNGAVGIYDKQLRQLFLSKISGETIKAVRCSRFSDLAYMSTASGKLIKAVYRNHQLEYTAIKTPGELDNLYEDNTGNLWVEMVDKGVALLKKKHEKPDYFFSSVDCQPKDGSHFTVFEDFNGTVWICYPNGELVYYDARDQKIKPGLGINQSTGKPFLNSVYRLYYDAGVIWICPESGGITKLMIQRKVFQQEDIDPSSHLPDHEVRAVYFDKMGRRWASSQGGSLAVDYKESAVELLFNNRSLTSYRLNAYSILEDSRGTVWIGTRDDGLYRAVPIDSQRTQYSMQHYPAVGPTGKGIRISSILEDHEHRLWIGTYDAGLWQIEERPDQCRFVQVPVVLGKYPGNAFDQVRTLSQEANGNIWAGTTAGLLILKPGENNKYKVFIYREQTGIATTLPNNDILCITPDSRGRMWMATAGGGLTRVTRSSSDRLNFKTFGSDEGLSNDYVLSCIEDQSGNIWAATEGGLSCIRSGDGQLVNYDSYDGLPAVGFSEGACAIDPLGRLVFATARGIVTFNAAELQRVFKPKGMMLTSLLINGAAAGPADKEGVTEVDINYLDALELDYDQNTVSISFAIPDYRRKIHHYSYRLLGWDDKWVTDNTGKVVFSELPPGDYIFEVKGDGEDYSQTTFRQLAINIAPPFWKSIWAYGLYLAAIIFIGALIRRTAIAMMRLRNKVVIEQELSELKLNFFTKVSHELRTPLTLILSPLQQLAQKETLSATGRRDLEVVSKNAGRMVQFVNQLLDFRKIQSRKLQLYHSTTDLVQLSRNTAAHFKSLLHEKQIQFCIDADYPVQYIDVDAERMTTVIYNLLANAFKFTPAGKAVHLRIYRREASGTLHLEVADQGPGVAPEELEQIFELFHSKPTLDSRQLKGTGVGLCLSRELIELHGGSLHARINEWGGLTVAMVLPLETQLTVGTVSVVPDRSGLFQGSDSSLYVSPAGQRDDLPRVMLVEDNQELRFFLTRQLSEYYRVSTATNGREGYQLARERLPDLIISDVIMPEMNGIEMLNQLRHDVETSHIPVVLLTAKASVESQIEGLRYGADLYITKPFNTELLMVAVTGLLEQRSRLFRHLQKDEASVEPHFPTDNTQTTVRAAPIITAKDETFLKEVIAFVEDKMTDPDFNIESIAGSMHMSRTAFYKKFKSLSGMTPVEFVRDRRLKKARLLLEAGTMNVSEVAYECGFNNPKYFSTCFKEKFGLSPTDYLKTSRNESV